MNTSMINKEALKISNRINLNNIDDCKLFPKYFEIETINACNARCIMCTIDEWTGNSFQKMDDKLFNKFVDEVSQYSHWIEIICLNRDGEPTLDKDIANKIKKLKQVGIKKVRFVTNAQNLTDKLAHDILDAGIDEVMFSIDSLKKDVYESIRVKLDFDKVLNNTLQYIKIRDVINPLSIVTIRMVEMEQNIIEKNDWLEFWNSKISKYDKAYTMPMHNWGNQLGEDEKKVKHYSSIACVSPFSSMAIHSDGKIGICAADYNTKNYMGDFNIDSIQKIWQGSKMNEVRLAHLSKNRNKYNICRGCDIWDRSYTGKL